MSTDPALEILKHFPRLSKFESVVMAAGGGTGIVGSTVVVIAGKKITEELAKSAAIFAGIGGVSGVLLGYVVSSGIEYMRDQHRTNQLKQDTSDFIEDLKKKNDPNAEKLRRLLNSFERGLLNEEQFCDNIVDIILKYCQN